MIQPPATKTHAVGLTALPRRGDDSQRHGDRYGNWVRIISDWVGGMRCAIIETIDCPENKEFPRSPCNAAKAQVPKRIAKG
jgi:hypothetical protein